MHSLPIFVKLHGRTVILVGEGEAVEAKARLIERAGGKVVGEDDPADAALAFVALDDEVEALEAVQRLRGRGLLVNAVDRPQLCDFTTPAIVDRSPVLIAVATGGASAGLAKAIRQQIEAILPSGLGLLADALKSARGAIKDRWPDAAGRRRAIDAALAPSGPLDPLSTQHVPADERVADWIGNPDSPRQDGVVTIRLTSNDPDDLTLRTARFLGEADHIVHSPDCASAILSRARADAARHLLPCDMERLDGLIVCLLFDPSTG